MKKLSGFSLMEMMVVLLIVSIVAAATAPMINKKMLLNASESSPWIWTGTGSNIAYNILPGIQTASIGFLNPPEDASNPRLYLHTAINGDNYVPQIAFGADSGNVIKLVAAENNIWLTSNAGFPNATTNSVVIGNNASSQGSNTMALGASSNASAQNAIALGSSNASAQNAIALGMSANASGTSSIAFGYNSRANRTSATALGESANASGNNSIALGVSSSANNIDAVSIGRRAQATGISSIAIGVPGINGVTNTTASGANSIALGLSSNASNIDAVSIGRRAQATGVSSIAIGVPGGYLRQTSTAASENYSIAIGSASQANSKSSIAIGPNATTKYNSSNKEAAVAIGSGAYAGCDAIAIGRKADATGSSSIAIGSFGGDNGSKDIKATGDHSIAIGDGAQATATDTVAIGFGAVAAVANTIVLGNPNSNVYIPGNLIVGKATYLGRDLTEASQFPGSGRRSALFLRFSEGHLNMNSIYEGSGGDNNIYRNGTTFDIPDVSDRRLKNVGKAFVGGLDKIKKLEVFNFTYKNDKSKTPHVGVMAQDLQKIFPDAVIKGEDGFLRIRMEDMFYALVNAVKELDSKIESLKNKDIAELKTKVTTLEKENAELKARLTALEKKVGK